MDNLKDITRIFNLQKQAYSPAKSPSYETRIKRLDLLEEMTKKHMDEISQALQKDFGTRSLDWIFTAEFYPVLEHIHKVKKSLKGWMKKDKKSSGLQALFGQRQYISHEPLGLVGIMSPFNAPFSLAFDPAVEAIAGGNRVIIKMSESTPRTGDLVKKLVKRYFKESELAVVTGDIEASKLFSSLAFDKFFFTGGSEVGKHILSAAAPNLTPVILELGGKSPCVLLPDADISQAARKIALTRQINGGQVCISGDYVLLHKSQLERFIDEAINMSSNKLPHIIKNEHFTSIINEREYKRITGYIDEAKRADVRVVEVNPMQENVPDPVTRKIPLTLVVNPAKNLQVAKYEIFGPVLTIFTYDDLDQAIEEINSREKALALYIFGKDKKLIQRVINETSSGGVTVNDLLMHANAAEMGFGGVGYSGMGRYKGGRIGFEAFTNPKAVFEQGLMGKFTGMFVPPYDKDWMRTLLRRQVGVK